MHEDGLMFFYFHKIFFVRNLSIKLLYNLRNYIPVFQQYFVGIFYKYHLLRLHNLVDVHEQIQVLFVVGNTLPDFEDIVEFHLVEDSILVVDYTLDAADIGFVLEGMAVEVDLGILVDENYILYFSVEMLVVEALLVV
jgi:hypothetical protein